MSAVICRLQGYSAMRKKCSKLVKKHKTPKVLVLYQFRTIYHYVNLLCMVFVDAGPSIFQTLEDIARFLTLSRRVNLTKPRHPSSHRDFPGRGDAVVLWFYAVFIALWSGCRESFRDRHCRTTRFQPQSIRWGLRRPAQGPLHPMQGREEARTCLCPAYP